MNDKEKMRLRIVVNNVFRPGSPVENFDLFAGRRNQINEVISATVQPGRHAIIFGERGVGKTSLARVLPRVLGDGGVPIKFLDSVTANCDNTDDFSSLWHKIFRDLSVVVERKQQAQAGFNFLQEVSRSERVRTTLERQLPKKVTPDDVRYVLEKVEDHAIIVIDEVDQLKKEALTLLASTIKNISDHSNLATLILVGIADSVEGLIGQHKSIERALVQIRMPRMSPEELMQIIDKAIETARMTIEAAARVWIPELSKGLPFYTHSLGLYSALQAIDEGRKHITIDDVATATRTMVGRAHTYRAAYMKATTSPQKNSLHDEVLLACAFAEPDELGWFTASAVCKPLSAIMKNEYDVPNFARHLKEFSEEKRGQILEKTGVPRRLRFRFSDPLMEPFVIIHGYATELLTEEVEKIITGR